jgi:hypothetical protein
MRSHRVVSMLLAGLLLGGTSSLCSAQISVSFTDVHFRVRNVGLGDSHATVLRRLGKPQATKHEEILDATCGPAHTLVRLIYKGGQVVLNGDLSGRNLKVVSIEIASPQLLVEPGVRVGMSEKEVLSKLGPPSMVYAESEFRILDYFNNKTYISGQFYFREDRLTKVLLEYVDC